MAEKLKPCPFCGSRRVRIVSVGIKYERDHYWRVKCDSCHTYGSYEAMRNVNSREAAEAKWNTRAEPERRVCQCKDPQAARDYCSACGGILEKE